MVALKCACVNQNTQDFPVKRLICELSRYFALTLRLFVDNFYLRFVAVASCGFAMAVYNGCLFDF